MTVNMLWLRLAAACVGGWPQKVTLNRMPVPESRVVFSRNEGVFAV